METGAFVLRNKTFKKGSKGKELDAKWFDGEEWDKFRDADGEQWEAHVKTGAVRILSPEEARKVDPTRILPIPARFVRTNKDKTGGLEAKSRMVVPGHLAPKGEVRTDAPVAPQVCTYLLLSLAATMHWKVRMFDVKDAFLSGKINARKLFIRPPKEGIKGVPDGCLIELIKSVFGLRESPRLWWLQFRDCILEAGFEELRYAPGVFVMRNAAGYLMGMLCVHVDDCLWAGEGP